MSLPLPNASHTSNAFGLVIYGNSVSGNLAGIILLFTIGVIFIMLGIQILGKEKGISIGAFLTWVITILFSVGEAVSPEVGKTVSFLYLLWLIYMYKVTRK